MKQKDVPCLCLLIPEIEEEQLVLRKRFLELSNDPKANGEILSDVIKEAFSCSRKIHSCMAKNHAPVETALRAMRVWFRCEDLISEITEYLFSQGDYSTKV